MSGKLILYPLTIIIFCAVLSQLMNIKSVNFSSTYAIGNQTTNEQYFLQHGFASTTGPRVNDYGLGAFSLIGIDGFLALIIGIIALGVLAGIHVLGSGLSDASINIIYKSVFYYVLWGIFSVFAYGINDIGISSIPIFGMVIYLFLTIVYSIGIQQQINTHEG